MSDKVFVDTNVLLYARDVRQPAKQPVAWRWLETLWRERRGCLSFQVLQEYYVNVTQKLKPGLPPSEARRDVRNLLAWDPVKTDGGPARIRLEPVRPSWILVVGRADRCGCPLGRPCGSAVGRHATRAGREWHAYREPIYPGCTFAGPKYISSVSPGSMPGREYP